MSSSSPLWRIRKTSTLLMASVEPGGKSSTGARLNAAEHEEETQRSGLCRAGTAILRAGLPETCGPQPSEESTRHGLRTDTGRTGACMNSLQYQERNFCFRK